MTTPTRLVQAAVSVSLWLPLCACLPAVMAASSHLKPVLKAIDPSTARVEQAPAQAAPAQPAAVPATRAPAAARSSAPSGAVPGFMPQQETRAGAAPALSYPAGGGTASRAPAAPAYGQLPPGYQPVAGYGQPQPGYGQSPANYGQPAANYGQTASGYNQPPPGYSQPQPGYGQPTAGYNQPAPGYGQPQAGYGQGQTGYNQSQGGYGQPGGFPPANMGYQQPGYGQPATNSNAYPYQGGPPQGYGQQSYGSGGQMPPRSQPGYGAAPALSQQYGAPVGAYGQAPAQSAGFASGMYSPAQPSSPQPASGAQDSTPDEIRVARLEQSAFGATYPEHEVDDRLEHLEREAFGQTSPGVPQPERLYRLEAKFGGGGAFSRTSGPMPPPVQPSLQPLQQPAPPPIAQQPAFNQAPPPSPPPATRNAYPAPAAQAVAAQPPARIRFLAPPQAGEPNYQPRQQPVPINEPAANVVPASSASAASGDGADAIVANIPAEPMSGDYFAQVQKFAENACARWTRFPIRVHLPLNSPDSWHKQVEEAVRTWSAHIPVIVAPVGESADIEVAWINHLPPRQLGITNLEIFNGRPRVTVYLLRPAYYLPGVPEATVHFIALHEIGHALGIWGHSSVAGDIMQPQERSQPGKPSVRTKYSGISARDLNTLRRVYQSQALPEGFQSGQPISYP